MKVDLSYHGHHLKNLGGPIWMKFDRLTQKLMLLMTRPKLIQELEFQYSSHFFSKLKYSISAVD